MHVNAYTQRRIKHFRCGREAHIGLVSFWGSGDLDKTVKNVSGSRSFSEKYITSSSENGIF